MNLAGVMDHLSGNRPAGVPLIGFPRRHHSVPAGQDAPTRSAISQNYAVVMVKFSHASPSCVSLPRSWPVLPRNSVYCFAITQMDGTCFNII